MEVRGKEYSAIGFRWAGSGAVPARPEYCIPITGPQSSALSPSFPIFLTSQVLIFFYFPPPKSDLRIPFPQSLVLSTQSDISHLLNFFFFRLPAGA